MEAVEKGGTASAKAVFNHLFTQFGFCRELSVAITARRPQILGLNEIIGVADAVGDTA
jgi:hypothetical protein